MANSCRAPSRRRSFRARRSDVTDLLRLTLREASEAVWARKVLPSTLVEAYLARIAAVDGAITSYILVMAEEARAAARAALARVAGVAGSITSDLLVMAEEARAAARAADAEIAAGRWRGPLHGLPFAVK